MQPLFLTLEKKSRVQLFGGEEDKSPKEKGDIRHTPLPYYTPGRVGLKKVATKNAN